MRLSFFYLQSRHPESPKEAGRRDHLVEGKEERGWVDYPLAGSAMNIWDIKFQECWLGT